MRFVVFSDVHRDAVTHGVERAEEVDRAVAVVAEDVRHGDVVVFGGDLCDPGTNRSYAAVARAIEWDADFKKRGAKYVFWLCGNHDVLEDGSGGSVLEPLAAAGARVVSKPGVSSFRWEGKGVDAIFLPHAPLVARYDPAEFLAKHLAVNVPTVVFGHLNPRGISPGSEVTLMPRGRDVMWPEIVANRLHLFVGGHIHRAQEWPSRSLSATALRPWDSLQIVGSPVRFDFGEASHVPRTLVAEWDDARADWVVGRKLIGDSTRLRSFREDSDPSEILGGDFVRGVATECLEQRVAAVGATFVELPALAVAEPRAQIPEGARKHRRVRDVVTEIASAYPTASVGLLDHVEGLLAEVGL